MSARRETLRSVVECWLGPKPESRLRITRVNRSRKKLWRYVCVESVRENGATALIFFRHDDGSWCVFPPAPTRPAMGVASDTDSSLRRIGACATAVTG
jgi:hypothetical protein